MNVDIPLVDYREYQKPFIRYMRNGGKRAVKVWHRRSGKDLTDWQYIAEAAIQEQGGYFYCLPEFTHARKVIWEGMMNEGTRFIDLIPEEITKKRHEAEMKIELVNGSIIRLVGSDQYDRLVGTNPKGIVFSEYSLTHPMAWNIMRPILAANDGWAVFNGTPRGKNHMYDIAEYAKGEESWYYSLLTVDDTNVVPQNVLIQEKREMDMDVFNQEYYCSFDAATLGAYYSEQIMLMRKQERVCRVPYEEILPVYTAFDPGDNTTAIVFFQVYGKEIRFIDAEEFFSPSVEGIYQFLKEKPYNYGAHFLPFDATVNKMSLGMSVIEQLRGMGLENIQDLPQQKSKMDGIKLVQSAFSRLWVDSSLEKKLITPLSSYAPKFSETRNTFSPEPEHNWASHISDAVRYAIIAINQYLSSLKKEEYTEHKIYIPRSRLG